MARRPKPPLTLTRKAARTAPKMKLVVFCEGENTEPKYLSAFAFEWGNRLVEVRLVRGAGVPLTLVESACREKEALDWQATKDGDSFSGMFEVWGLFDVDEHPRIPQARAHGSAKGVRLAISNPCFDLWGVLHYEQHDADEHRHKVQKKLGKLMPSYAAKGSKVFDYSAIHDKYEIARARAIELSQRREQEGNCGGNPSTDVFKLLDLIILHGKPIGG